MKICFWVLVQYFLAVLWTQHWLSFPFCLLLSDFQMGCGFRFFSVLSSFTQCTQCRAENHLWNTFCFLSVSWTPLEIGGLTLCHVENIVCSSALCSPMWSQGGAWDRLSIPCSGSSSQVKLWAPCVTWIKAFCKSPSHLAQHIHTFFLLTRQALKVQV